MKYIHVSPSNAHELSVDPNAPRTFDRLAVAFDKHCPTPKSASARCVPVSIMKTMNMNMHFVNPQKPRYVCLPSFPLGRLVLDVVLASRPSMVPSIDAEAYQFC